jgi:hypothetical protein
MSPINGRQRVAAVQSGVVPLHSKLNPDGCTRKIAPESRISSIGRINKAFVLFSLVLLMLASGPLLSGQSFESRVDDIVSRTWVRVGPFRVVPEFTFRHFGWVSNIYGRTSGEKATSDFLITPSLKVDVYVILRRRLILSFTENPEYLLYLRSSRFNHFNNNYGAGLSFPFLGRLVITGGFSSQAARHLPLAEVDRQVETRSERINVEAAYETSRRLSWALSGFAQRLSYGDILLENDERDDLAVSQNREEVGGQLEVRYDAFRASRLFFQLGYTRHDFNNEEAGWKDAETRSFMAGIRFPRAGRLSGSLAMGFKKFQPGDRSLDGFSGLVAQAQLGVRLGAETSLSLGYNRDTSFSYWSSVLYYLGDTFNAGLTLGVGRFLETFLGGFFTLFNYPRTGVAAGAGTAGPPPGWTDKYGGFQAGFTVPVWKNIRAGLTYQYWTRPSGFLGSGDGHLLSISFRRR